MLEFFEKNWGFFVVVTIVASFVIWSVNKDRKEEEKKKQEKNIQKKTEESQKDKKG